MLLRRTRTSLILIHAYERIGLEAKDNFCKVR